MLIYITIFFVVLAWAVSEGQESRRGNMAMLGVICVGLALFVGMSDMLGGYDRYIYAALFDEVADNRAFAAPLYESRVWVMYGSEFGYCLLNNAISYVTANRYIFIFIVTCIIYVLAFMAIRRTTNSPAMAMLLFLGLYFFFTFTYLRQAVAVMVAWNAYYYIAERKLLKFLALMFVAYSLHNSAIVFVPMYFMPVRKFSAGAVIACALVAFLVGLTSVPSTIFELYGDVADAQMRVEEYISDFSGESGVFRIEYLVEAVFFLGVILSQYSHLGQDKREIVMMNAAIVFCMILLVFLRSLNGGRLGWTYMLGVIITMTTLASRRSVGSIYRYGLIVLSFGLFMRIIFAWGSLVTPYKTFLTPGVREGDYIHEHYEYDSRYDEDKFFR